MRRGPKPAKSKEAKPPSARKSPKDDGARVGDLEKRLEEALQRETEGLKREAEALEQQSATAEILRIIGSSPADAQPVFDAIAVNALRLCDAEGVVVTRYDGTLLRVAAVHNVKREAVDRIEREYPRAPSRDLPSGRAVLDGVVVHVPDLQAAVEFASSVPRQLGAGSHISIPLLHQGRAIGVIGISRWKRGPFPDRHIELLKTFASQAVIAIENVRLFNETKEALEQQTATAEILRVISSSPTDVQPVFDAIARSAVALCGGRNALVLRFDGEMLQLAGHHGVSPEGLERNQRAFPRRPWRDSPTGRAFLDRSVVHVPDRQAATEFVASTAQGAGSLLAVPLLREQEAIGVIGVTRDFVGPFSSQQIELLKTFADQAVIAIENVRLFNETKEALEQQRASGEILRVISSSPTDIQPVFDVIVQSAMRLCGGLQSNVYRVEDGLIHLVAHHNFTPEALEHLQRRFPMPISQGEGLTAHVIREGAVVHLHDAQTDPEVPETTRSVTRALGARSVLYVPMLRDRVGIGVVVVSRAEVKPFSDKEIALIRTFADQAVIAMENVRLFTELQEKNRALTAAHAQVTETLEQQTATSEILSVISGSPTDTRPVFDAVLDRALTLCEASHGSLYQLEDGALRNIGERGIESSTAVGGVLPLESVSGRAVLEKRTVHIEDVLQELGGLAPQIQVRTRSAGVRTLVAVPLLREQTAIGAIVIRRLEVRPFSDKQIRLLQTFADQAVIAIENVRLFKELQASNRELTTALDTQTATSDILHVISRSPTDVQPVFDTIVRNAASLCHAANAGVFLTDGQTLDLPANHGSSSPEALATIRAQYPRPLDLETTAGVAILTRSVVHVADTEAPGAAEVYTQSLGRLLGVRSMVAVPMMRKGEVVGAINLSRQEPGRFSDAEVELLKTFADQAGIAIENVRLFTELQARTQELTRSVGQLTALGEVGQAVSSSLDLQTVLTTIVSRAVQLSGLDGGVVFEYDAEAETFVQRAAIGTANRATAARQAGIRRGEGVVGRTALTLQPVQIPDISVAGAYEGRIREELIAAGVRALVAVPILREARLIGGLAVNRDRPGEFSPETVELLQTFAAQSALAIENARLFREIEEKSHELEAASRHKSEFLANMSHELRTPLNAIIGFSEVLSERMFGDLNEKQEEYLKDIYASGQHLLSLINDILDLSKIEAGRMELELSDFDLPTAINNALMLVRERAGRRSIALHTNIDHRLGQIQADERKVRQVVLNLLSNAIKFTPEGGRIEVLATPKDGLVEVSVTDTGVGIALADQEAVFEEFRQVGTPDKKVEGTGLGLTLCRKFVELHGGRIWVKSEPGAGATFTFSLPLQSA